MTAACERGRAWLLDLIRELVACESPSDDRAALEVCGDLVARRALEAGATVSRVPAGTTADHVVARWPGDGPPVLIIGHYDTVWRVGQIERMPIREADGKLFGPGVLDMKAGLGIGLLAARTVVGDDGGRDSAAHHDARDVGRGSGQQHVTAGDRVAGP